MIIWRVSPVQEKGFLWLKIKSIYRKTLLNDFCKFINTPLVSTTLRDQFRELHNVLQTDPEKAHTDLNRFIKSYASTYSPKDLEDIASELHKMQYFSWGDNYTNALDKFLVDNYVKKILHCSI